MTPRTNSSSSASLDAGRDLLDRDDQRRVARRSCGSPSTISVSFANALRLSFDRALATLRSNRFSCFAVRLLSRQRGDLVDVDAGVPEVEVAHPGEAPASPRGTSASPPG